jgi:poly(3-hydroxybutyrate) depolymerase
LKDFSGLGLRGPIGRAPPSTSDIVPEGTRFIAGAFTNAAGSRTYKLFIPSRAQGQSLPLVVMLHGCTQSPDDFAAGTRMNFLAEEQNCFVVYPEQPRGANQAKCWNWFRTGDQQRGGGEPSLIAGITRQIMRDYSIDPKRVYVGACRPAGPPPPSWARPAKATSPTTKVLRGRVPHGHAYTRTLLTDAGGLAISEHWNIHGAGHAWSGGSPAGSYTDPRGPDATREMLRFFLEHSLPG